jgi:hypothetical protein
VDVFWAKVAAIIDGGGRMIGRDLVEADGHFPQTQQRCAEEDRHEEADARAPPQWLTTNAFTAQAPNQTARMAA